MVGLGNSKLKFAPLYPSCPGDCTMSHPDPSLDVIRIMILSLKNIPLSNCVL